MASIPVREGSIGSWPSLVAGSGEPLVMLAGLAPQLGVGGPMRALHEGTLNRFARFREVHYVSLRPGLPRGISMAEIAAECARGLEASFAAPVDVLGMSTGGSVAQQLAADHPGRVRRLVLLSTACRLGPAAKSQQRAAAARVRAGAGQLALAMLAAELAPPALRVPAGVLGRLLGPRWFGPDGLADMATVIEAEDSFDLARLAAIAAPALLVAGGRDRFYPRELFTETAQLIPDCRLELHPKRGHITVISNRQAVAQIRDFLSAPGT